MSAKWLINLVIVDHFEILHRAKVLILDCFLVKKDYITKSSKLRQENTFRKLINLILDYIGYYSIAQYYGLGILKYITTLTLSG